VKYCDVRLSKHNVIVITATNTATTSTTTPTTTTTNNTTHPPTHPPTYPPPPPTHLPTTHPPTHLPTYPPPPPPPTYPPTHHHHPPTHHHPPRQQSPYHHYHHDHRSSTNITHRYKARFFWCSRYVPRRPATCRLQTPLRSPRCRCVGAAPRQTQQSTARPANKNITVSESNVHTIETSVQAQHKGSGATSLHRLICTTTELGGTDGNYDLVRLARSSQCALSSMCDNSEQ
jgi:hypothetical protein